MSSLTIGLAVLAVALAGTTVYWWRRAGQVATAMTTSRERDERIAAQSTASGDQPTLAAAASAADCPPDELPARIERFQERLAEQASEIDRLRATIPDVALQVSDRPAVDPDEPHVLTVVLSNGTTDDAQRFADDTVDRPGEIAFVVAGRDGSVAVTVGEQLRDTHDAAEIVAEITDRAGGGGGGSTRFATAGGVDPADLESVVEAVAEERRDLL